MRVGIVTFYNAYNCGAYLQAFALQKKLKQMGADVYFLDQGATIGRFGLSRFVGGGLRARFKYALHYMNEHWVSELRRKRYDACIAKHFKIMKADAAHPVDVDCVIAGSDQIWNPDIVSGYFNAYLLEGFTGMTKAAYAASFGVRELPASLDARFKAAFERFKNISVREEAGAEIVKKLIGVDVPVVLDPTLLLDAADYVDLAACRLVKGSYLCAYSVGDDDALRYWAQKIAKKRGLRLVYVQNGRMGVWGGKWSDWRVTSPDRFLSLVRDAECVLTNSFHGTIFSILYNKPFASLINSTMKVSSRFETMLKSLGLMSHLLMVTQVRHPEEIERVMSIEYEGAMRRLRSLRIQSEDFIHSILRDVKGHAGMGEKRNRCADSPILGENGKI